MKAELERASLAAFEALLIKKGLNNEAQKALTEATAKVAAAHGFKLGAMEELDEEELKAVAGGYCDSAWFQHEDCDIGRLDFCDAIEW